MKVMLEGALLALPVLVVLGAAAFGLVFALGLVP